MNAQKPLLISRHMNMEALAKEPDAGRILGWVIAANDLALTFYLQTHFKQMSTDMHVPGFSVGSRLYIDRLMCAQTSEAILMAPVCQKSTLFTELIASYNPAEEAFQRILKLSEDPSPEKLKNLRKLLSRIRNKGTFHYYEEENTKLAVWLQEAVQHRTTLGKGVGAAVFSEDGLYDRYSFADDVFGEVFFRNILETDMTGEKTLQEQIIQLTTELTEVASDVRIVGDAVGKAMIDRFSIPEP